MREPTLLRGLSTKIHSVEKGRLDDSQMSQKLEKDPSKCQAFLKHKETAKAKLNMSGKKWENTKQF